MRRHSRGGAGSSRRHAKCAAQRQPGQKTLLAAAPARPERKLLQQRGMQPAADTQAAPSAEQWQLGKRIGGGGSSPHQRQSSRQCCRPLPVPPVPRAVHHRHRPAALGHTAQPAAGSGTGQPLRGRPAHAPAGRLGSTALQLCSRLQALAAHARHATALHLCPGINDATSNTAARLLALQPSPEPPSRTCCS